MSNIIISARDPVFEVRKEAIICLASVLQILSANGQKESIVKITMSFEIETLLHKVFGDVKSNGPDLVRVALMCQ